MANSASNPRTHDDLVAEESGRDTGFRAEWDRLSLAREVAAELVRYRSENSLSQRALAERLGVSQPRVARLESGEHNPDIDTLVNISRATGIEFLINISPADRPVELTLPPSRQRRSARVKAKVPAAVA